MSKCIFLGGFILLVAFKGKVSFAQDTLFYPSGEIQVVQLLSINKNSGLITYKVDGKTSVRAISSLSSFTNHAHVQISDFQVQGQYKVGYVTNYKLHKHLKRRFLHGYDYGHWSFGMNLLSPLTGVFWGVKCVRQSGIFQYNFNNNWGARLQAAVGMGKKFPGSYYANNQIHYEFGLESVYIFNDQFKKTAYLTLGAHVGKSSTYHSYSSGYPYYNSYITKGPDHIFYRVEFNVGIQRNFAKNFAFNLEGGLNYNNVTADYSTSVDYPLNFNLEPMLFPQMRVHLIYRVGGKLKKQS